MNKLYSNRYSKLSTKYSDFSEDLELALAQAATALQGLSFKISISTILLEDNLLVGKYDALLDCYMELSVIQVREGSIQLLIKGHKKFVPMSNISLSVLDKLAILYQLELRIDMLKH